MLQAYPALVLNADFRPLSVFPLETKSAEEAIKNLYEGTVSLVAEYDKVIRSAGGLVMRLPSVIALKTYVHKHSRVSFTNENVFLRDRYRCQYCGERRPLTIDHVIPRSKGGRHAWTNVVAACDPCNSRKGDRLDMEPMKVPREPTPAELLALKRAALPRFIHPTWLDYIPDLAA